jgi:hypothetical protein
MCSPGRSRPIPLTGRRLKGAVVAAWLICEAYARSYGIAEIGRLQFVPASDCRGHYLVLSGTRSAPQEAHCLCRQSVGLTSHLP